MHLDQPAPRPIEYAERSCDDQWCLLNHPRTKTQIREHVTILEDLANYARPRPPTDLSTVSDLWEPECEHDVIVVVWSDTWHHAGTITAQHDHTQWPRRADGKYEYSWTSIYADHRHIDLLTVSDIAAVTISFDTIEYMNPRLAEVIERRFRFDPEGAHAQSNETWQESPYPVAPNHPLLLDV